MSDNGKLLVLEVCRGNNTEWNISLEVTFPSGFEFAQFCHKPYSLKRKLSDRYSRSENITFSNRKSRFVHVPDELFLSLGNCWNILACRAGSVYFENPKPGKLSFGWVALQSATQQKKRTLKYFYI